MATSKTNGFDDLDILDLNDLLSDDPAESEPAEEEASEEVSDDISEEEVSAQAQEASTEEAVPETPANETEPEDFQEASEAEVMPENSQETSIDEATQDAAEEEPAEESVSDSDESSEEAEDADSAETEEDLPDGIQFVSLTDAPARTKAPRPSEKDPHSKRSGQKPQQGAPHEETSKKEAPSAAPAKEEHPKKAPARRPASPAAPANGNGKRGEVICKEPAAGKDNRRELAREDAADEPAGRRLPLHLILPILIVAVLAIAVVRFAVWSKGHDLNIDTSGNTDRFNIEVNDNMVYLPDSKLEGHKDDGVTTILCLGNEPFSEDTSDTGLAAQIAALGNCNVINASFPDSQVTCENASYRTDNLDSMDDIFNLFYVSYAISIQDFTSLKTVASAHTEDPSYLQSVEALEDTDFDQVDMIVIMYDGIDYINGMAMQNPDVPDELTTYVGSLRNSFQLLQEKYPYIRIVFLSPYYAEYDGTSSRTTDLGNGTIVNYFQWAYDTCGDCSVSFLDNYYGSVNETNYKDFLSDGIHLNADGRTKIADHFVYKVIQDNYAEYNAQTLSVAK